MNWQEIRDDPMLRDLPYKIETDRWGHIVMSPASNRHSMLQAEIQNLLRRHLAGGFAFPECSVQTTQGVKVADVAWGSDAFFHRHGVPDPYPEAPEIVVEVASPSNSLAELEEKMRLYFERGAREVWLCGEEGGMAFFSERAALKRSLLAPEFPCRVRLPFA